MAMPFGDIVYVYRFKAKNCKQIWRGNLVSNSGLLGLLFQYI